MLYEIPQLNYLAEKGCSLVRDFCYKPQAAQALKVEIQALRRKYKAEKGLTKIPDDDTRGYMIGFLESVAREVDQLSSTSDEGFRGKWSRLWGASGAEEKAIKLEQEKALILTGALIFIRNLMVEEYKNAWVFKDPTVAATYRLVNDILDPSEKSFIQDALPEPYLFSGQRYIDNAAHLTALQALQAFLPKINESKCFQALNVSSKLSAQMALLAEDVLTLKQQSIIQVLEKQQRIVTSIHDVFIQASMFTESCVEDLDNMRFAITASKHPPMAKKLLLEAANFFEDGFDAEEHDADTYFKGCLDIVAGGAVVASLMLLRLNYQHATDFADKHCEAILNHALRNTTANPLDLSCQRTAEEVVKAMELYGRLVSCAEDKSLYQAPWGNTDMSTVIDRALTKLVTPTTVASP